VSWVVKLGVHFGRIGLLPVESLSTRILQRHLLGNLYAVNKIFMPVDERYLV
jgi:hypothetical protein